MAKLILSWQSAQYSVGISLYQRRNSIPSDFCVLHIYQVLFCKICPAGTASGSIWYWVSTGYPVAAARLVALAVFLALMLFVQRGFCKIVCPIGAGLAVFNRISLLSLKFLPRWCSECLKCLRNCPSGSGPMDDPRDPECMYCMDCFKCSALKADFSADKKT